MNREEERRAKRQAIIDAVMRGRAKSYGKTPGYYEEVAAQNVEKVVEEVLQAQESLEQQPEEKPVEIVISTRQVAEEQPAVAEEQPQAAEPAPEPEHIEAAATVVEVSEQPAATVVEEQPQAEQPQQQGPEQNQVEPEAAAATEEPKPAPEQPSREPRIKTSEETMVFVIKTNAIRDMGKEEEGDDQSNS